MQRTLRLVALTSIGGCGFESQPDLGQTDGDAHVQAIVDLGTVTGELAVAGRVDSAGVESGSGALAAHGDTLYALDEVRELVLKVSADDGRVLARLPADGATRIAVRPDGERLYAAGPRGVLVTDADLRPLDRFSLPTGVVGLGFAPDGVTAYASLGDGLGLAVIDTGAPRGDAMGAVRLVVADRAAGALVELDPDGRVQRRSATIGDVIGRIAVDAAGRTVAAYRRAGAGSIEDGIVVADMASGGMAHAALGAAPSDVALDGAGGRALVALEGGAVALVDVEPQSATFCQVVAWSELGAARGVALGPDGGSAYAYAWDPERGEVVVLDATLAPVRVLDVR